MLRRRLTLLFACVLTCSLAPVVRADWRSLGDVTGHEHDGAVVTLTCGAAKVQLIAMSDAVVRVRLAPDGTFPEDRSWAVTDLAPHGRFEPGDADENMIAYTAGALRVNVQLKPCRITVLDAEGNVLVADDPAQGMAWKVDDDDATAPVRVWQQLPDGVSIFGLGEKAAGMHRGERTWVNWNTDEAAYRPGSDPIYVSIPFFIAARGDHYHGVFLDNTWRSSFDFERLARNTLSFGAEGGELNYYVIAGPDPKDVVTRYTALTGRMPLPPRWAIGYQQCRYSYFPEARVREVAQTFRAKKIPCDVLYFDIDYMDGYRCFTWNHERFPDPAGMMDDLHDDGFHTIAIIDPGIKNDPAYSIFESGSKVDAWVKKPDGEPYVGRVWPGDCVFPDFAAERVRDWWAGLYPPFLAGCGLDGIWNDMNEPANFLGPNKTVPLDLRHDYGDETVSHRAAHNIYGMQMARATLDGLQRTRPEQRPFTVTRANYAGGQRYAAIWTGDNVSSWEHLRLSIPMALGCGISGMPFVGPDIGGFVGGATPELYARWIQFGALLPFSRTHTSCNNPDQEPWSFGPRVEQVARTAIERRYAWMPYIYTLFEEAARTGVPIVRPIWLEQPGYDGWSLDSTFFLGSDVLVAPKLTPGEETFFVNLPAGVWFEGNTGAIYGGNRGYAMPGHLDVMPYFFRGGALVPTQSVVQHTGEKPAEPLILEVWPWGESRGTLYEDDGISYMYRDGGFRRTNFSCSAETGRIAVQIDASEGDYAPAGPPPLVRIHRVDSAPEAVQLATAMPNSDATVPSGPSEALAESRNPQVVAPGTYQYDGAAQILTLRLRNPLGPAQRIEVSYPPRKSTGEPVTLRFDGNGAKFLRPRGATDITYRDGAARFTVRWGSRPVRVLLPRLSVPADALPTLELQAATQHATRAIVRFSSESDPEKVVEASPLELTADGDMHTYRLDMRSAGDGGWRGTVYWMEIEFTEGTQGNEEIAIAEVAFGPTEPRP
ncbi:MAG TPA: glycoside hydrolase family 31 protein [Phycisphaerae bacterium]|mgnify:CR=1 FL=1|nr:DUF4968 domain-containing protein [Phycisphaerales bacterium]HRX87184.1 glycoside hydrolase family 31 protein [Phycisphaerae bacterium]